MHSNCILNSVANLLVRHMVFVGNIQKSLIASKLGSFSRFLLSKSSSHRQERKVDKMSFRISLTLEASEMFLSLHMIFSLERAIVAWAILETIAPRYLLFSTSSSLWPFILISLWKPFVSRRILKRVGESRHPCRTPAVVLNHSPVLPLNRTALCALSYRFSMARMMLALMLYFLIVAHKASCHTISKAFLKSIASSRVIITVSLMHTSVICNHWTPPPPPPHTHTTGLGGG